jgi:CHAT domain-containing protein/tetratricopeptide (TPR) repeat protein
MNLAHFYCKSENSQREAIMLRSPVGVYLLLTVAGIVLAIHSPAVAQHPVVQLRAALEQGGTFYAQGDYRAAADRYERALRLAPQVFGVSHTSTGEIANNLAEIYRSMGEYAKAEQLFQRSLRILKANLGNEHPHVVDCLSNLATVYWQMGQYAKAEQLDQLCLRIRERRGKNRLDVAESLNNLALVYADMADYAKAEPLYQRCIQIKEANLGRDHPNVARSCYNLANLYKDVGEYAKAEPLYQRCIQIQEARLGKDHPELATGLQGLANLYRAMGNYAQAESFYQRSLEIQEAKLGKDHPALAAGLESLANLYRDMGHDPEAQANLYKKAEPLYQRCLEIQEANLGRDHPEVATTLNNLGLLYFYMGEYAKAEPLYRRCLQIQEAKLGMDHPDVAKTLNNLALLHSSMNQYTNAELFYQRSLEIEESKLGKHDPGVAKTLHNLALLYCVEKQWQKAAEFYDASRRIVRGHVARTLPVLSEREQLLFLQHTDLVPFCCCQSLGLARRTDRTMSSLSAAWVLNGKAVAQESLAQRTLLARDDKDPRLGPISRELGDVRRQLATLFFADYKPDRAGARLQRIDRLQSREQQLNRQLAGAGGGRARDDPWIDVADARKMLPDNAVLIEICRFNLANFNAHGDEKIWQGLRYVAWVIPGRGDIQLIDMGDADKIEDAVWKARQVLQVPPASGSQLGAERGPQRREPLEELAKLVLQPLKEHIADKEHWLISPDGDLWLVPWGALPLGDGGYAIEKHRISYLVSGRDLVQPTFEGKTGPALVLADPDYDLGLREASAELKQIINEPGVEGLRRSGALGSVHWDRLPGTAKEVEAIAPKLSKYTEVAPHVYTGKQALEGVFEASARPRVVVLSTHAFFLEDQDVASVEGLTGRGERGGLERILAPSMVRPRPHHAGQDTGALENPLLRCGLVLAGANNRGQAESLGTDDGLLTGLEVVGADLRGTELAVLSACETGLGRVHSGEGVAGLRQAFELAGAQAVVAALWKVPDAETAELMTAFFDNLAAGKGKADALREAQRSLIRSGRKHPFYWAAFTLTGQWK